MTDLPLAHPEWLALVAAMRFAPEDDTPRLVGADWLTETGKPELDAWAQFIRVQCEGARHKRDHNFTDSCNCGACAAERKSTMVFDRWGQRWWHHTWGGFIPAPNNQKATDYARGFTTMIVVPIAGARVVYVPRQVAVLFDRQPVRQAIVQLWRHRQRWSGSGLANYVCSIDIRKPPFLRESLRVKVTLTMPPRTDVSVSSGRTVMTRDQLRRAISACVRESIKKRSALTV